MVGIVFFGLRASTHFLWKFIAHGLSRFLCHTLFVVGNGEGNQFWEDVWRRDSSFSVCFPCFSFFFF